MKDEDWIEEMEEGEKGGGEVNSKGEERKKGEESS